MKKNYLSVMEAATAIGVSPTRIRQLAREGHIEKIPFNLRSYAICPRSLARYATTRRPYVRKPKKKPEPEWTDIPPTEEGHYWLRHYWDVDVVVYANPSGRFVYELNGGNLHFSSLANCKWQGPLHPRG